MRTEQQNCEKLRIQSGAKKRFCSMASILNPVTVATHIIAPVGHIVKAGAEILVDHMQYKHDWIPPQNLDALEQTIDDVSQDKVECEEKKKSSTTQITSDLSNIVSNSKKDKKVSNSNSLRSLQR